MDGSIEISEAIRNYDYSKHIMTFWGTNINFIVCISFLSTSLSFMIILALLTKIEEKYEN